MALKECFTSDAEEIQERRLQLNGMKKDSTVMLQSEMLLNKNQKWNATSATYAMNDRIKKKKKQTKENKKIVSLAKIKYMLENTF